MVMLKKKKKKKINFDEVFECPKCGEKLDSNSPPHWIGFSCKKQK